MGNLAWVKYFAWVIEFAWVQFSFAWVILRG